MSSSMDSPSIRETLETRGGAPIGFERGTTRVQGADISHLVGGAGPPLVLLHGWPQTAMAWAPVAPALAAAGYTVIAPDLPGTGGSDEPSAGYGKDEQASLLRELVAALGHPGPVRVVGHDIGGMVAFSWARQFPQDVERLVLVDLALPGLGLEEAMDVARGGRWHFVLFMTPDVPELLLDGSEDDFFAWWFSHLASNHAAFPPAVVAATTASYRGRDALRRGFGHYRTLLADGEATSAWARDGGRLEMPVAAVGGAHTVGGRLATSLTEAAPQVRRIVVADAGHFVAEERPDEFLAQVGEFLS